MKHTAKIGDWIKDEFRNDRSLGFVMSTDSETNMMLVRFPKISKDVWLVRENRGQYKVII
tara:strand:- start:552 stop:731 length:180 start_codon:yes stop_codon:yes gene_type:complete